MNEIDIVRDISRRFEKADISYMLTGSMAMNYYAQPRMTRDIDVVIALGLNDVEVFNLIHHESVIKIDFIVRKKASIGRSNLNAGRRSQFLISQLTSGAKKT